MAAEFTLTIWSTGDPDDSTAHQLANEAAAALQSRSGGTVRALAVNAKSFTIDDPSVVSAALGDEPGTATTTPRAPAVPVPDPLAQPDPAVAEPDTTAADATAEQASATGEAASAAPPVDETTAEAGTAPSAPAETVTTETAVQADEDELAKAQAVVAELQAKLAHDEAVASNGSED